jgi:hypothetical protein
VAAQNELPVEFFARLIWQESRLRPDAVGPVTRNGKRAQGITLLECPRHGAARMTCLLPQSAENGLNRKSLRPNSTLATKEGFAAPLKVG